MQLGGPPRRLGSQLRSQSSQSLQRMQPLQRKWQSASVPADTSQPCRQQSTIGWRTLPVSAVGRVIRCPGTGIVSEVKFNFFYFIQFHGRVGRTAAAGTGVGREDSGVGDEQAGRKEGRKEQDA